MRVVNLKKENIKDLLLMSKNQVSETIPHVPFDEDVVLHNANWIAENPDGEIRVCLAYCDEEPAGYLVAYVRPYLFNRRLSVGQEVVYVVPKFRGTEAFKLLMLALDDIAEKEGALECYGGVANGRKVKECLSWFQSKGYEKVGFYVRKVFDKSE